MIVAENVSKRFGARSVLEHLDLQISPGAVTLLVGANGAGKTTFLRIAVGLARPDEGTVRIQEVDVSRNFVEAAARFSFLPQAPRFNPRLTSRQILAFYARLRGRTIDAVEEAEALWGIGDHRNVTSARLSGGLRQRLALAVFSLAPVSVLVLDEPGLSLDPEWRERLQQYLSQRAKEGATVLVATHLLGEWEGRVDRCVVLERGRVSAELSPDRLRAEFSREPHWASPSEDVPSR